MTIHFNEVWSKERVERLTALWAKGESCSIIAALLGGQITRNSVIGKVHRLQLPDPVGKRVPKRGDQRRSIDRPFLARPAAKRLRNGYDPSMRRNPSHNILAAIAIRRTEPCIPEKLRGEAPDGSGIKLIDLKETSCRFPRGDPREPSFEFCGGHALPELPYCAHHSALAYQPTQVRNRAGARTGDVA